MAQPSEIALPLVIQSGRLAAEATVDRWLRQHGREPNWRPRPRYTSAYCMFLAHGEVRRKRDLYDACKAQQWKCWECGYAITPRIADRHHSMGYNHLGEETPSELVAIHRGPCHERADVAIAQVQHRASCANPRQTTLYVAVARGITLQEAVDRQREFQDAA